MLVDTRPSQRFSLLLLDEGEYYFDDYSAYYYYPLDNDEMAFKRRVKGRLKLCSGSLIFDPEDLKLAIMKLSFRYVDHMDKWQGGLLSTLPAKADLFLVRARMQISMKENNQNAPYSFTEGVTEHRFSLNYVPLHTFLPRATQLLAISKLQPERMEQELKTLIEEREASINFNTSYLQDINEKIHFETTGVRVTPLVNDPGKVLITDEIIYFQPFNNISVNPVDKFRLESVVRMQKRRYILRHVGIELFFSNEDSVFFAFKSPGIRDAVYDVLIKQSAILRNLAMDDQHNMTLKWQNRLISNYEYLMYVNSMSGRSFNDLTQYPVFPWVIADYTSKHLNLNNPNTFRDLSKPIGALNPERLNIFKKRMQEMPDTQPGFLYGTHYSTPGYVLYYLVRQAPEFMLRLQNGKFDAPSRMFHSIADAWTGVMSNPADVKELIPEFYNTKVTEGKNFLNNSERLNLGVKPETGVRLDDVLLPPWADDSDDFINKCNLALESDYVSEHLNEWIDLVFGYKQQGLEALKADNVFYHLTYEGAVDIDSVTDPLEKMSTIAQIKEFGQTPKQAFSEPHPQRLPRNQMKKVPSFSTPDHSEPLDVSSLLSPITGNWNHLDNISLDFSFKLHKDLISDMRVSSNGSTLYSVSQDTSLKIYSLSEMKQLRSVNLCDLSLSSLQLTPDEQAIIIGSWDNNIYLYSVDLGRVVDTVVAHDDAVSCLCLRNDILASGSWDATVKTWQYTSSGLSKMPLADFVDFDTEVHCIDVAKQGNIAVAGAADGSAIFLDLRHNSTIRSTQPHEDIIHSVQFTPDGSRVVTCSADQFVKVLEVGGSELFSTKCTSVPKCISTNGDRLLVGEEDGSLRIFDMKSGDELKVLRGNEPINCLSCPSDGSLVVAGCGGSIRVFKSSKD